MRVPSTSVLLHRLAILFLFRMISFSTATALVALVHLVALLRILQIVVLSSLSDFLHSVITDGGGALWHHDQYPSPTVHFSFFSENQGTDTYGHDCCFRDGSDDELFLHCLSATQATHRTYPTSRSDAWLPLGTSSLLNIWENKISKHSHD